MKGDSSKKSADEVRHFTNTRLENLTSIEDDGDLAVAINNLEAEVSKRISDLRKDASISKPRGIVLTKILERDWAAYQRMSGEIRSEIIEPLNAEVFICIRNASADRISDTQRRESALRALESERKALVKDLSALRRDAYVATEEMRKTLKQVVRQEFALFSTTVEKLLVDFTRKTARHPDQLEKARTVFNRELEKIREEEGSLLEAIRSQMQDIAEALKERETAQDSTAALEQRAKRLEEQLEFYSDFAQMGMAVGILQHEFEKTARNMRTSMRDLKPWADGTPELGKLYRRLRNSFDHLDGYLKLLDPLGRRLHRTKIELSGDEIRMHLLRIFRPSLGENHITLEATDLFLSRKVRCRSSVLLGAFVNVLDNAIYWGFERSQERESHQTGR